MAEAHSTKETQQTDSVLDAELVTPETAGNLTPDLPGADTRLTGVNYPVSRSALGDCLKVSRQTISTWIAVIDAAIAPFGLSCLESDAITRQGAEWLTAYQAATDREQWLADLANQLHQAAIANDAGYKLEAEIDSQLMLYQDQAADSETAIAKSEETFDQLLAAMEKKKNRDQSRRRARRAQIQQEAIEDALDDFEVYQQTYDKAFEKLRDRHLGTDQNNEG